MATYYPITGGGNWNSAGTWNTSPNQATGNAPNAPLSTDDVILDQYGGAVTVDATTCVAKTLVCNHANANLTFTSSQKLTVSGNVTFVTGMTLAGTGTLEVNAAATLTSGGLTFPGALIFSGANTKTLSGSWINTGLVTISGATVLNYTTAETFTCNGGLTMSAAISGTATIILGGTGGTWSGSGTISSKLTINCTTLTVSGTVLFSTGTLTYTAGTITTTGSTITISGSPTINTAGMTWNNITFSSMVTLTLTSNLTCSGTATINTNTTFSGAYNFTCGTLIIGIRTIVLVSGQTYTVTESLKLSGNPAVTASIASSTASSPVYLVYSGTPANCQIYAYYFTDIDASGSAQGIDNWYGGTLTRCSGITNRTSADIGGAVSDVFGIIG